MMRKKLLGMLLSVLMIGSLAGFGLSAVSAGGGETTGTEASEFVSDVGTMTELMTDNRLSYTANANNDGSKITMPAGSMPIVTSTMFTQDLELEFEVQFANVDSSNTGGWLMGMVLRDQWPSGNYHFNACPTTPVRGYQIVFDHTKVVAGVVYGTGAGDANLIDGDKGDLSKTAPEGTAFDANAFWAQKNVFKIAVVTEPEQTSIKLWANGVLVLNAADNDAYLAKNPITRPGGWTMFTHGFSNNSTVSAEISSVKASYGGLSGYQSDKTGLLDMSQPENAAKLSPSNGTSINGETIDFGTSGTPGLSMTEQKKDYTVEFDFLAEKVAGVEESWMFTMMLRDQNPTLAPWVDSRTGDQGYAVDITRDNITVNHKNGTSAVGVTGASFAVPQDVNVSTREGFWGRTRHFRITLATEQSGKTRIVVETDGAKLIDVIDSEVRNAFKGGLSAIAQASNYHVTMSNLFISGDAPVEEKQFDAVDDALLSVAGTQIDLISGRGKYLSMNLADWNESISGIRFPASGIPSLYTQSGVAVEDTELNLSFEMVAGDQPEWSMMLFLRDQAAGKATWNRSEADGNAEAYYLVFTPNRIALKYVDKAGSSAANIVDGEASILSQSFWGQPHEMKVTVKTLEDSVKVQVVMDGKLILSARDTNKAIARAGGFCMMTHGHADSGTTSSQYDLTALSANVPERSDSSDEIAEVEDEEVVVSGTQIDMFAGRSKYLVANGLAYNTDTSAFHFPDAGTPILYTSPDVEVADSEYRFTLKQTSGNLTNWQMMIFFRDQAPGYTSWNRSQVGAGSGAAYFLQFDPRGISVHYVDKAGSSAADIKDGTTVIPSDVFWHKEHEFRILVKTLEDSVKIQLIVDDRLVISATDANKALTEAGGFGLLTHGREAGGATANFSTFDLTALTANVPEIGDFETETKVDFTELVANVSSIKGSAVDSASKSYITPTGVRMDKFAIRNVNFSGHTYGDFTLKFKASIEWTSAKDWGAVMTFRDDTPDAMPWDTKHGSSYCLMWGYEAGNDTTNLIIWRYYTDPVTGEKSNAILGAYVNLEDNGTENTYELVCGDVESGVRMIVKRNGEVMIDLVDSEKPIRAAGGITLVSGSGCNLDFNGLTAGPDRSEVMIGGKESGSSGSLLPPVDNPDYDLGEIGGLLPSVSDPEYRTNTGLVIGLSAGGGVLAVGAAVAVVLILKKRRKS